jgi:hypothetical protein
VFTARYARGAEIAEGLVFSFAFEEGKGKSLSSFAAKHNNSEFSSFS